MDYTQTIAWLFAQLPMYQRIGKAAYKADLAPILALVKHLGRPERQFKSIHVAGTNGKGSVSHMLASVLQEAGYKTGLYTSPHLKDFRERIRVNGEMIPKEAVIDFVTRHKPFLEENALSFFEMTVGLAFDYFARQSVDIAVVETGLGGRLDSTNILLPEVSVITNIGYDHTQFLGDSLEKIAREKAGIIKPGTPVVIGETQPEIQAVFEAVAAENQATITFADKTYLPTYQTDLQGDYQKQNLQTARAVLDVLKNRKAYRLPETAIINGLQNVVAHTGLLGRWQILQQYPTVICDTGHNAEGLSRTIPQLLAVPHEQLHLVLGVVADKDLSRILPLFPKQATYYFCKPDVPRGKDAYELQQQATRHGLHGNYHDSVQQAYQKALQQAEANDLIFVGGSTFVVAEVLENF